jgi:hypothetical protein
MLIDMDRTFSTAIDTAIDWHETAARALTGYAWLPDARERRIAGELGLALRDVRLPDEHPHVAAVALSRWAPAIPLVLAAAGWTLPAGSPGPAPADHGMTLPGLLAACHHAAVITATRPALYELDKEPDPDELKAADHLFRPPITGGADELLWVISTGSVEL